MHENPSCVQDVANVAFSECCEQSLALSEEGDQSWMMPLDWEQYHRQIRHCYQYIQMKVKLFFIFEEQD